MVFQELVLLLASVLSAVSGQFLLKAGALKLVKVSGANALDQLLSILMVPQLILGLGCYALGSFAYILLLARVELSIAGPAIALSYVFSVLLGYFAFQEAIPFSRMVGVGLIVCGVILVLWLK